MQGIEIMAQRICETLDLRMRNALAFEKYMEDLLFLTERAKTITVDVPDKRDGVWLIFSYRL